MNILKKTVLTGAAAGLMGCAASRHVETGVVISKQDLPQERALFVSIDNDDRDAERKLFVDTDVDSISFMYVGEYDVIKYTNNAGGRFPTIGNGDRIIRINGVRVKRISRAHNRTLHDARTMVRDSLTDVAVNDLVFGRVMRALEQTR